MEHSDLLCHSEWAQMSILSFLNQKGNFTWCVVLSWQTRIIVHAWIIIETASLNSISSIAMHLEAEMKKCFWLCLYSVVRMSNTDHLLVKEQNISLKGLFLGLRTICLQTSWIGHLMFIWYWLCCSSSLNGFNWNIWSVHSQSELLDLFKSMKNL